MFLLHSSNLVRDLSYDGELGAIKHNPKIIRIILVT
ncbi:MAG: hypothetical protein METHAR1v1_860003 [Methanothrix sp.]|nr:MAG: hypothetical protein METHAR1v1_860003 [Methanothrix sp.]